MLLSYSLTDYHPRISHHGESRQPPSPSLLLEIDTDVCRNRDFNAPGSPATADTSAGAVAAAALINLATIERSLANTTGSDYYVQSAVDVGPASAHLSENFRLICICVPDPQRDFEFGLEAELG